MRELGKVGNVDNSKNFVVGGIEMEEVGKVGKSENS